MVDIRSTAAEIRRGKKEEERNYRAKIYMVSLLHRATINSTGESTPPCLTPHKIRKLSPKTEFHNTAQVCREYQSLSNFTKQPRMQHTVECFISIKRHTETENSKIASFHLNNVFCFANKHKKAHSDYHPVTAEPPMIYRSRSNRQVCSRRDLGSE